MAPTKQDTPDTSLVELIAKIVRSWVDDGTYQAGARLPGLSSWKQDYGYDREPVLRALRILVDEGVVEARGGASYFVRRTDGVVAEFFLGGGAAGVGGIPLADLDARYRRSFLVFQNFELASGFGVPADTPLLRTEGIQWVQGHVAWTWVCTSPDPLGSSAFPTEGRGDGDAELRGRLQERLTPRGDAVVEDTVSARPPTMRERSAGRWFTGHHLLVVNRVITTHDGRCLARAEYLVNGAHARLRCAFGVSSPAAQRRQAKR